MRIKAKLIAVVSAVTLILSGSNGLSPASAANWVPTLAWGNLHVKNEPGVFEKFRREFDAKSQLIADSETQHNEAWVRIGQKSFTAQYVGTAANAGQQVQFVIDSDVAYTDSLPGTDNIATVDQNGVASVVITPSVTPKADDAVRISLKAGTATVGTMLVLFEKAGYMPIVKLLGSTGGPQANCDYKFDCQGNDLWEATYEWSVFSRSWLPDYSQVYAKSYLYGSTINLRYRVFDVWSTPIAKQSVSLILDPGCSACKWGKFTSQKNTDANGYVSFSLTNTNTKAQVMAYKSVNPDTKEPGASFLPFSIHPTTNDLEESIDYYWPQIVPDLTLRSSAVTLTIQSRGGAPADMNGNVVVGSTTNPALSLDPAGTSNTDQIVTKLQISYLRNAEANMLYAPDIKVTSTNGGYATLVTPTNPVDKMTAIGDGKTTLITGYNNSNHRPDVQLVLTGTKPGTTTWTISVGGVTKTVSQTYKN